MERPVLANGEETAIRGVGTVGCGIGTRRPGPGDCPDLAAVACARASLTIAAAAAMAAIVGGGCRAATVRLARAPAASESAPCAPDVYGVDTELRGLLPESVWPKVPEAYAVDTELFGLPPEDMSFGEALCSSGCVEVRLSSNRLVGN